MPTRRKSSDQGVLKDSSQIDRAKFDVLTDEDIRRQIEADPDAAPQMTDEDLRRARVVRPARGVKPAAE